MCKHDRKFGRAKSRLEVLIFQKLLTFCLVVCLFIVSFLNTAYSETQLSNGASDDIIKVEVIGNEIVGLNTLTNVRVVEKLKEGEIVTSALSKGKVGAVLTDRRLLGFNATNNLWSSFETFFSKAVFPDEIKVSSNMAVAIAKRRVYAYTFTSNEWMFELMYFQEQPLSSEINDNLIFVITSDRLLAFSFHKQRWFPQTIHARESITHTAIGENFVTVATENKLYDNRILTFDAKNGAWTEERLRPDTQQQKTELTSPSEQQTDVPPAEKSVAPKDASSKS